MPADSYPLSIKVFDTDGSTVMTGVQVNARNETTSETINDTTDGTGRVVLNAANFTSEYTVGDVITIWVVDNEKTVYTQHTTTQGGTLDVELTLINTSLLESTDLRYFTASEFREHFCLTEYNANSAPSGIKTAQIERIGVGVELQIDNMLGQKFDSNNGSFYTAANEYHDVNFGKQREFFSNWAPINTVTKFEVNRSDEGDTESWTDLVAEGSAYYSVDTETGRFRVEESRLFPYRGARSVRLTYTYGLSSVPVDIKQLAILMTGVILAKSELIKLAIAGTEMEGSGASINIVDALNKQIESLQMARMRKGALNI